MGKLGKITPCVVARWPAGADLDGPTIFCPCVGGLKARSAAEMAILPIHDANGTILAALPSLPAGPRPDYAGLCLCDPFCRLDDLLTAFRRAGVGGITNFPTVAALGGADRDDSFDALFQKEVDALERIRAEGFATIQIGRSDCDDGVPLSDLLFDADAGGEVCRG